MYKADVNHSVLNDCLDFLIKQGMIEKQTIKNKPTVFAVTQHGITVLKYFRELMQALPITEETRKQTNLLTY
jgi:predicted transcriptional regulator